jgi:hypothetical protein
MEVMRASGLYRRRIPTEDLASWDRAKCSARLHANQRTADVRSIAAID